MKLDDVDLEILKFLSQDGRKTYHYIAEKLRKSPVTIKKHVEELEASGIIKDYGVKVDYEKLGYNIIAAIEITISKGKMLDEEKKISEDPHVFGVYDVTGGSDALVLARFKDRKVLSAMVKKIHESPNVERTNTHIILNIIKEGTSLSKLVEDDSKNQ